MNWKKTGKRSFCAFCIVAALIACGRKLPPKPSGLPDPIEIISMIFVDDTVRVKARINTSGGNAVLLGKTKGICPACTDDLVRKHEVYIETPGVVLMKDSHPDSMYMVYRIAFEKGESFWITEPRVVKR